MRTSKWNMTKLVHTHNTNTKNSDWVSSGYQVLRSWVQNDLLYGLPSLFHSPRMIARMLKIQSPKENCQKGHEVNGFGGIWTSKSLCTYGRWSPPTWDMGIRRSAMA